MYFFTAVYSLPMLIACVVGLVLVRTRARALPPRSARLATLGLSALLASTAVSMAWQVSLPFLVRSDMSLYTTVAGVEWLVSAAFSVAGLGLLIAAVLARSAPPAAGPYPYPAPQPPFIQ
ncbi:hypothetical protein [Catenuloplanes japonicus]|uniref:hypothetical protein n=1 Tax=Catenuloplanes japonicus TaxID=33876 RepID=UPI00052471F1|nr:hypothetical protein [Catenuloplanes japonicus]